MIKTAILVDGGFYRKRAKHQWGMKTAEERARELNAYCLAHLDKKDGNVERQLYRIFYYDCAPSRRSVYHPLTKKNVDLEKSDTSTWTTSFMDELKRRRKYALRLGVLAERPNYNLRASVTKDLLAGKRTLESLTEGDFEFNAQQKGVDMRIGIDIVSLALKRLVDQIILIAGDSDFVPAAKLARREGIDFILDPMGADIKADLFEHIDGLETPWKKNNQDSLNELA
ncbi:NYN domain-containing protein [Selenomonas sp. AB3002]|uniref:NYN domain-containing protein n=1 Tax=Selenomonas sp. AB3002 TaxID=1392502 RepID=UPI0004976B26